MIVDDICARIGNTPLMPLHAFAEREGVSANLLVKVESANPGGSVKDRVARQMIFDAEETGVLVPGSTIIEPTSGNTGIGLAMVGRARGYRVILTMPETMSMERRQLLHAYGAELVLTPGKEGMAGAIAEADRLCDTTPGAVILGQFVNPSNPKAHELTTGPEIWLDTDGRVDMFVACVGTGGTITGTGRYLKSMNPGCVIVAVEPAESPVLEGGTSGPHGIQGIGAGFVPEIYDPAVVDRVVSVTTGEAYATARLLADSEGILAGISSGAALFAAAREGREAAMAGKNIVVLLPDGGERYLSTGLFG